MPLLSVALLVRHNAAAFALEHGFMLLLDHPLGAQLALVSMQLLDMVDFGLALVAFAIPVLEVFFTFVLKYMFLVGNLLVILLRAMLQHLEYRLEVTVEKKP